LKGDGHAALNQISDHRHAFWGPLLVLEGVKTSRRANGEAVRDQLRKAGRAYMQLAAG
jgi:hypothetical protein